MAFALGVRRPLSTSSLLLPGALWDAQISRDRLSALAYLNAAQSCHGTGGSLGSGSAHGDPSHIHTHPTHAQIHNSRRYPLHFCAFERCCFKFSDDDPLQAQDLEHLPTCHEHCFKAERDQLTELAKRKPAALPRPCDGLLFCHRVCYMKTLLKAHDPNLGDMEPVPENRTLKERFRIHEFEHWREARRRAREKTDGKRA